MSAQGSEGLPVRGDNMNHPVTASKVPLKHARAHTGHLKDTLTQYVG